MMKLKLVKDKSVDEDAAAANLNAAAASSSINFDKHKLARFYPSERLGMGESFIIWFVLRGGWVNFCLSHYVQMDCKPDAV